MGTETVTYEWLETVYEIKINLEEVTDDDALLEKIEQANEKFPEKIDIWYLYTAFYLLKIGKVGRAFASLKKAHNSYETPELIHVLSLLAARLGFRDEAIYYLKLSTILTEPNKDLLPGWLPEFEEVYFAGDEERYMDGIKYLVYCGYYQSAYEKCQDLFLANETNIDLIVLILQLSLILNHPYDAIKFVEKLIDYFQGNLISIENLIIAEVFMLLGQAKNTQIWIDEAKKNYFPEKFLSNEKRLSYRNDPLWQEIKIHAYLGNHQYKQKLERQYIEIKDIVGSHQENVMLEVTKDNKIKLGIIIHPDTDDHNIVSYIIRKLGFFQHTNLMIIFYIDRPERDRDNIYFSSMAKEIIYISEIDSETLAVIMKNEMLDILLDINDYAIPTRPDLVFRKPAKITILFAGDAETASLWGYDAVLGDAYIYPLEAGQSMREGEYIIQHHQNPKMATILRLRESFLQYMNFNTIEAEPYEKEQENFILGVYCKRMDLTDEKILFLTKILQRIEHAVLIFETSILGGEVMFQEILEKISQGNVDFEKRIIMPSQPITLDDFTIYVDVMLPMGGSQINLMHSCLQYSKICLCCRGQFAIEKVNSSMLLDICTQSEKSMIFEDWQDALSLLEKLSCDVELRKKLANSLRIHKISDIAEWTKKIIIMYDDLSYILLNFHQQKISGSS